MVRSLKSKPILALTSLLIVAAAPSLAHAEGLAYSAADGSSGHGHPGGVIPTRFSSQHLKVHGPRYKSGCTGNLSYGGGPVISKVEVVAVFWGSVGSEISSWAPGYLKTLVNSPFIDQLSEYNVTSGGAAQKIVRGTVKGTYPITPKDSSTSLSDNGPTSTDIGTELAGQIASGALPAPTFDSTGAPNTLYVVFFAPGISISNQGGSSCSNGGFCGYHQSFTDSKSRVVPYAVIPDMSSGSGCDQGCSPSGTPELDTVAATVSHEIAEAITDVDVGDNNVAWYDNASQPCGGEIGDLCADGGPDATSGSSMTGTIDGITVQYQWSNHNNKCQLDDPSIPPQGGTPAGCATNSDCAAPTGTCNPKTGACVGCVASADCGGSTPFCNTSTNTCGGCTSSSECAAPTSTCVTASTDANKGKCVECTSNKECSGAKPICGANDTCGGCTSNAQCTEAGKTTCDASGACGAPTSTGATDAGTGTGGGDAGTGTGTGEDAGSGTGTGEGGDGGTGATTGGPKKTPTLPVTSGGCAIVANDSAPSTFAFGALAAAAMLGLRRRRN
ncbi:MAG: hypothetical protein ACHREM_02615 [Polyangiales bacterium]